MARKLGKTTDQRMAMLKNLTTDLLVFSFCSCLVFWLSATSLNVEIWTIFEIMFHKHAIIKIANNIFFHDFASIVSSPLY